MKVLEYIQSLIVPTHMYKRRKINILISLLIMILGIFALSTPIASHLSKMRYETLGEAYDFKVFEYADPEDLLSNPVTDEERSKYNILSFDELKALGVSISAHGINNDDKIEAGKEYVLKANSRKLDVPEIKENAKLVLEHLENGKLKMPIFED